MDTPRGAAQVEPLTVRLLGRMEVWRNGSQILDAEWDRHQTKWLLALLLSKPGAVFSYDRIIDALLEGSDPRRGRQNLYALVSRLRRTLQPDLDRPARSAFIVRRGEGYAFNTDAPFSVDTQRFEDLIREANRLEQDARFGEARNRYRQAVDLYADDYVSENRYEDWTLELRQSLREQYLRALEGLATCQARTGELAVAISTSERLIRTAPHQEQGYRLAMYYHYCAGAKERAETAYHDCVRSLKESLGVEPSRELIDLRQHIRTDTAPHLAPWVPHNLPSPITSFIGRDTEIAELCNAVHANRLVTLLGPGGIGKTRLAIEAGSRLREPFRDGVWLADLGTGSDADHVPQQLTKVLGVDLSPGQEAVDAIAQQLQAKSSLLILDTCERAIDRVAPLAERLLEACPNLHILATSREALNIPGELIQKVPPLELPEARGSAANIADCDAVRLFAERTRLGLPGFEVTEQNADVVARLCRKLDGLPLAIELAASQARGVPIAEILHQVEEQFMAKAWNSRAKDTRLRSLDASVAWSYDRLPPSQRAALKRASVFAGGFDLEAAREVLVEPEVGACAILDCLKQLEEKSLLVFDATPGAERYRLLDTIRAFGRQRLAAEDELEVTTDRHLGHFGSLARRASKEVQGPLQGTWLRKLDTDLENLRAALRWALEAPHTEAGLLLTCDLCQLWMSRNLHQEGLDWSEAFLAQGSQVTTHARGKTLWLRSRLQQDRGLGFGDERSNASRHCREELSEASRLFDEAEDRMWWARCKVLLANNAFLSGNVEEAKTIYQAILEVDRQIGNRGGETACLANLARIHLAGGKPEDALPLLEEALGIAKKIGSFAHEQSILVDLGNIHESRGAYDQAWRLWERGLEISRERGDRHGMVRLLVLMAILARDQNWAHCDPDVSESYWSQAMGVAQDTSDVNAEVRVLVNHGEILRRAGEIERAKSLLADGLRLTQDRGTGLFAAPLALSLAEIFLAEGDAESTALLVGAVRTRHYALLDEQILHQSEIEIGEAVRKVLGDARAETAFDRGARMGLRAVTELTLDRPAASRAWVQTP